MDHEAAREHLELAALEPGGLERLMAGDTAIAQAVAAHLAGCASCSDELIRLERTSAVVRSVVREEPPSDLRDRTLATIRASGVGRPLAVDRPIVAVVNGATDGRKQRSRSPLIGQLATIAAAVVLSVVATSLIIGSRLGDERTAQEQQITALEHVTTAEMAVAAEPDAQHVSLRGVADLNAEGQITYSPSTTDLVVVASGLIPPADGQEYRCWVEVDGQRQGIGRMYFSDDLSFWAGESPELADAGDDATFGITLVAAPGSGLEAGPVLLSGD
jgi:Anti-sigma-K factor rskA, C-terminal